MFMNDRKCIINNNVTIPFKTYPSESSAAPSLVGRCRTGCVSHDLLFVPEFLSHFVGQHGRELLRGHAVAQPGQDGLEVFVGLYAEHVAGAYEREVNGGVARGLVAVDEQPVLAPEGDGPYAALDDVIPTFG